MDAWFLVCGAMGSVTGMTIKHLADVRGLTYGELHQVISLMVESEPHPWL